MSDIKTILKQCCFIICAFAFFTNAELNAQEIPEDQMLADEGWRYLYFDEKTPNTYQKNDNAIAVKSNQSVSMLYKDIEVDLEKTPTLSWSWKVTQSAPTTDLTEKGADDRSLALYVSFPFDEENASFWEHLVRGFVVALKGENAPGRVITYVWGDDEETGTILESPYLKSAGAMVMLQKATTFGDQWIDETVNVAEDYKRIFGVAPIKPFQIAISADTDDTNAKSLGFVRDIRFE